MPQKQGNSSSSGGRIDGSLGAAAVAANFVLGAGWGATATIAVTAGSTDQRGTITITASATPAQATATVTHSFADGAFASAPFPRISTTNDNALDTGSFAITSRTTTGSVWTHAVLPVAAKIYIADYCYVA